MKTFGHKRKKRIKELISNLDTGDWNLSHEREFAENLFVGRFNYFLVVFSLFTTAGFANTLKNMKYLPFYAGAVVLLSFWIPLYRAYLKHDRIIKMIFSHKPKHPTAIVEEIMREEGLVKWFVVSRWMGVYIPMLCVMLLVGAGIAIGLEWWT